MNKQLFKRTLSMVLSLAMLCSMTGLNTVFAAGGGDAVADSDSGAVTIGAITATPASAVTVTTAEQLRTELEKTAPATIDVTADIAMAADIRVAANHTLNIAVGKTVTTGDNTLVITDGKTLTLAGTGTLKANNSVDSSAGIAINAGSTLALQDGSKLVAANSGQSSAGVDLNYDAKLTGVRAAITTENTGENSKGITERTRSTVSLTGGTLTVKNGLGSSHGVLVHTLTTSGTTISIANTSAYGIVVTQASITGGTVSVTSGGGISGGGISANALTLENTAVTVNNTSGKGISVPQNGSLSLAGSTIALQNTALIDPDAEAGMYLNGGITLTMDATSVITVASNADNIGLRGLSSAKRNITAGAKITLAEGAGLSTVEDCFDDQGIPCTNSSAFTVGAASAAPTWDGLSAGDYVWNGKHFAKTAAAGILINEQNFPDANFRGWLLEQPYGADGKLTPAEIAGITGINVSYNNIASLTGIQHFTALTMLECGDNRLTKLDVSGLTALKTLWCSGNQLTTLDVSGLTALTNLKCGDNRLTKLENLPASLSALWCSGNQLTKLENLPTGLVVLYCGGNRLTKLENLPTSLVDLDCISNRLTALNVSALTKLTDLDCSDNSLTTLDVSALTKLTRLRCADNYLTTLGALPKSITSLNCVQNRLKALDVSGLALTDRFTCQFNYLPDKTAVKGFTGTWDESNFRFFVQHPADFVAVHRIVDTPTVAAVGVPLTLTGNIEPSNATHQNIVWSLDSFNNGETESTITGNVLTAKKPGTVQVIATIENGIAAGVEYTESFSITVMTAVPVTGITLDQTAVSLYHNASPGTATLTATVSPSAATDKSVTWASDNAAVASVDQTGKVTAHAKGTAVITATTTDGGFTASCTVTVSTHSGGGSTGSSGGSVSSWKPEATVEVASPSVDATGAVKPADVAKAAAEKLAAALKAGKKNPQANVVVENATSVSAKTLQELAAAAKKAGGTARLLADTTANGKVVGRMYVDTALAANLKSDVLLRVTTNTADTAATAELFQKHFGAKVAVVSLAQQGPIGMRVQIAVKADPAIDTKKPLYFYVFDKKTNRYYPIANPAYTIDKNGWLYFYTTLGGEILYTATPLKAK